MSIPANLTVQCPSSIVLAFALFLHQKPRPQGWKGGTQLHQSPRLLAEAVKILPLPPPPPTCLRIADGSPLLKKHSDDIVIDSRAVFFKRNAYGYGTYGLLLVVLKLRLDQNTIETLADIIH